MDKEIKMVRVGLNSPVDPEDYIDKPLAQVIAELTDLLNSIPSEYRGSAKFELNQWGDQWGDHGKAGHEIYYERPETNEEAKNRIAKVEARKEARENRERANLAALKAKYEPN